jgi:TFIIS helical bundle-like domain
MDAHTKMTLPSVHAPNRLVQVVIPAAKPKANFKPTLHEISPSTASVRTPSIITTAVSISSIDTKRPAASQEQEMNSSSTVDNSAEVSASTSTSQPTSVRFAFAALMNSARTLTLDHIKPIAKLMDAQKTDQDRLFMLNRITALEPSRSVREKMGAGPALVVLRRWLEDARLEKSGLVTPILQLLKRIPITVERLIETKIGKIVKKAATGKTESDSHGILI